MLRVILLSLILVCFSSPSFARVCHQPPEPLKTYPVVFKGIAQSTKNDVTPEEMAAFKKAMEKATPEEKQDYILGGIPQVTKFKVVEAYKGGEFKQFDIHHSSEGSIDGGTFNAGEAYIVYARHIDYVHKTEENSQHYTNGRFECEPTKSLKNFQKTGRNYSSLKLFVTEKKMLEQLLRDEPDNPYYLDRLGALYEGINNYPRAADAYLSAVKSWDTWPATEGGYKITVDNIPFFGISSNYGRMLYMQEKYEEALAPLKHASGAESARLYAAALIKLKKFAEIKPDTIDLRNMTFDKLDLTGAKLKGLDLSGAKIGELILHDTELVKAKFAGANIRDISVEDSQLREADFSKAEIGGSKILSASFSNANFTDATIYIYNVDRADFSRANFQDAEMTIYHRLTNSHFDDANLSGFDLSPTEWMQSRSSDTDTAFEATFKGASYNSSTKWFMKFDPVKAGAKKTPVK